MSGVVVVRAILVWLLIILVETIHGIARRLFLEPLVGDLRARQIGVLIGSLLILTIAILTIGWLRTSTFL
jgi:hypothetical protein